MKYLSCFNTILEKICIVLSGIGLCLMTGIIAWQIFGRYVLDRSPAWSTALAMLLMVYVALLMVAVGVKQRFHLRLWIGLDFSGEPYKRQLMLVNYVLVMLFGSFLFIYGIALVALTYHQTLAILAISRSVNYVSLVISGFGIVLFSLEHIIELVTNKNAVVGFLEEEYDKEVETLQYEEL